MQEVATQGVSSDSRPLEVSDDPLPELDASNGTNGTNPPDRSLFRGGNPKRRGRLYRSVNTRREEPVSIDYSVIHNMIEQTVTRLLTSLAVSSNPITSVQQSPSAQTSSASRTSVPPSKVAQIMQKWNIQFDGSAEGLSVDEFMYRAKVLTDETLDGDLSALCKHIHILFVGRARDWYWRYHKKVDRITWSEFCLALRQQYRDYKSEFASSPATSECERGLFSRQPATRRSTTAQCRAIPPVAYGKQPAAKKTAREVQVQGATCG
ncbi:hypothetical protein ACLKA6_001966 [Drosophila palustris]